MLYATGMTAAGEVKPHDMRSFLYTYVSFFDAAKSIMSVFGDKVSGSKSPDDFLTRLQDADFNSDKSFIDPKVLNQTAARMKCPG